MTALCMHRNDVVKYVNKKRHYNALLLKKKRLTKLDIIVRQQSLNVLSTFEPMLKVYLKLM